jgi:pimeloyl-ACP methyl ester carboxylesterase
MRPIAFASCFGWLHHPAGELPRGTGVVLCPGLLDDGCSGHRPLRQLADALAAAGYPTVRFDYRGTGDSADLDDADCWPAWLGNVHAAADWLRRHAGVRRIVLVGLRFGATLAASAARDRTDVVGLVLLAPVLRGRSYLRQLAIEAGPNHQAAAARGMALREIRLSEASVGAIGAVDLSSVALPPDCRVAVFATAASPVLAACVAAWRAGGAMVDSTDFAGLEAMQRPTFLVHEAQAQVGRIVTWLRGALPDDQPASACAAAESAAGIGGGDWHETPVRFGRDGMLVGVLCRPAGVPESDMALLIGNSSGNPHYGYARFAVALGRRLAGAGVASLRFDFAGLGDSVAAGDAPGHCFETDRSADIAAAIDALGAHGYRRFAIAGLCSGAYHALHGALADARIGTLLLVNLPLFRWRVGDSVEFYNHATENPARFLAKLADRSVWSRLFQGRLGLRERLAMQGLWCVNQTQALLRRVAPLLGLQPPVGFAQRCMRVLATRSRTLFLLSEGDESIEAVAGALGPGPVPPGITWCVVPGIDHSVTDPAMQRVVADRMMAFLEIPPAAAGPAATSDQRRTEDAVA